MPLEELALDLLFEAFGEHRYNRTPEEYQHLASLIPPLKQASYLVNQGLKKLNEQGEQRSFCRFKPGDLKPRYEPFPKKISIETLRKALINAGFRDAKWRKKT
ncbi:hypothetical protein XH94_04370 [Bradyrhizobium zhanjiangense]|uniref:Uncharacterized protein n=2 Tax=Bradyrhizobium zhanjiangense TaxID=1325107 RepID=A0A4Q0STV7_9BRAD|nr:hypothetical protein XH94_04370 [Bradyrhizobium zhanjiangense]